MRGEHSRISAPIHRDRGHNFCHTGSLIMHAMIVILKLYTEGAEGLVHLIVETVSGHW